MLHRLSRSPNVHVVAADARHLPFSGTFDRILADVPCSGTGTLARNPEIKWRLKSEDLRDLQQQVTEAVAAYFDDGKAPHRIRLYFVSDPILVPA